MAFADYLNQTCRIERPTPTEDAWGNRPEGDAHWQVAADDVACRLIILAAEVLESAVAAGPVVTRYTLLVEPDVEVQQNDRVVDVMEPDGTIRAGVFHVEAVMARWAASDRHHVRLELRRVS
jgi:hypothetical protein